jgi:PAN domain
MSVRIKLPLAGAALVAAALCAAPVRSEIISIPDMARGKTVTQQQCAADLSAIWVSSFGRNFCIRYYLSTAGREGSYAVVFLNGDASWKRDPKTHLFVLNEQEKAQVRDTNDWVKFAERISRDNSLPGIYLARPGLDGSSGWHGERHTLLELNAVSAALDAIKQRFHYAGFHVYGHSGGGWLVGGLLGLRADLGCVVPADGPLGDVLKSTDRNPAAQYIDASAMVAAIARNTSTRIMVVQDPEDHVVSIGQVLPFLDKLRKAGGKVEAFYVNSSDPEHHYTTPQAALVMRDCIRGASHEEVAADLAAFVAKDLARAVAAEAKAHAAPNAPVPNAGRLLDGINLPGADYFNFPTESADPALCQKACSLDANCAAWTFVRPGAQGLQARCWLKNRVPQQAASRCCISGIKAAEGKIRKGE